MVKLPAELYCCYLQQLSGKKEVAGGGEGHYCTIRSVWAVCSVENGVGGLLGSRTAFSMWSLPEDDTSLFYYQYF